ncbi:DUF1127 domain-containing protein [Phaeovulum sp.]|uniref:DUF1127 domain-containing protein n=1 Tax=Phaeovulum sp. TaxID=2934796 RepID=UPI0039E2936D
MSVYNTNAAAAHSGFSGFVSSLMSSISAWNDARQTRIELSKLSDRELDDIGLTRGDIDRVAKL